MSSALPLWWLALPLLLLPVWWHRQRRQRPRTEPLATARFLPVAAPLQRPIWRWADRALLLLRCLLLLALMAWLADVAWRWRGDTVLLGAGVEPAWAQAQIASAGLAAAPRLRFCAAGDCDVATNDILAWLQAHEREWQAGARLLVVARGDAVPMPAGLPRVGHRVDLRIAAAPLPRQVPAVVERHVVLASDDRAAQWRAVFAAFDHAGLGNVRHVLGTVPDARTELIVWDRAAPPPADWHAPLWWLGQPAAMPELARATRWRQLRYLDTARGRLWALDAWPLADVDGLRALYADWQGLQQPAIPYAAPSLTLAAGDTGAMPGNSDAPQQSLQLPLQLPPIGALQPLLAPSLALLFALERGLAHVRRRR